MRWTLMVALLLAGCAATAPPRSSPRLLSTFASAPAPAPAPAPALAPAPAVPPVLAGPITFAAVGDLMLARTVGARLVAAPPEDPFAAVASLLRDADVAAGNLECAVGTTGVPARKAFTFRAPPVAAAALAAAGIDVVSLANNHILDFGPDALRETLSLLDAAGIAHAGAGMTEAEAHAPAHLQARGKTLAFLAYVKVPVEGLLPGGFDTASWEAKGDAPGLAWADPKRIAVDVAAARAGADAVVVMLHSGFEGEMAPNLWQIEAARAAIDAGAVLVLGAHPHVLQGAAHYKSGFIAYSLGNFVFDGADVTSAILHVTLDDAKVTDVSWTPVLVHLGFPRLVDAQTGAYVTNTLKALSMPL